MPQQFISKEKQKRKKERPKNTNHLRTDTHTNCRANQTNTPSIIPTVSDWVANHKSYMNRLMFTLDTLCSYYLPPNFLILVAGAFNCWAKQKWARVDFGNSIWSVTCSPHVCSRFWLKERHQSPHRNTTPHKARHIYVIYNTSHIFTKNIRRKKQIFWTLRSRFAEQYHIQNANKHYNVTVSKLQQQQQQRHNQ